MSAADGSPIDIAMGIIIAIIDIGPSPGSIPMNVPMRHPPIIINRFFIENAVASPMSIPSIILCSSCV